LRSSLLGDGSIKILKVKGKEEFNSLKNTYGLKYAGISAK
jgi:hypothetical protein